jgi:hypothetical protein
MIWTERHRLATERRRLELLDVLHLLTLHLLTHTLSLSQPYAGEMIGGRARVLVCHLRGRQKSSAYWGQDAKGDAGHDESGVSDTDPNAWQHDARGASKLSAGVGFKGEQAGGTRGGGEERRAEGVRGGASSLHHISVLHHGLGMHGGVSACDAPTPSPPPSPVLARHEETQEKELQWLISIVEVRWPVCTRATRRPRCNAPHGTRSRSAHAIINNPGHAPLGVLHMLPVLETTQGGGGRGP